MRVFIDGKEGTTGLKIYQRLENRNDVELITLSDDKRKDIKYRKEAINSADLVFLCLPDFAAIESVSLLENPKTIIIDSSTAHRTEKGWAYGFPELSEEFEQNIINSKRIAVPGCHASGFIALVFPLIKNKIISKDTLLNCFSLTGYSGGGKKMIAQYEDKNKDRILYTPRQYALGQNHKHLKEMKYVTDISNAPVFCPVADNYFSGMQVTVPLFKQQLEKGRDAEDIKKVYKNLYKGPVVTYKEIPSEGTYLGAGMFSGKDSMAISVFGNSERILLTASYDNLGKGASGAAIECFNLVSGKEKISGLNI